MYPVFWNEQNSVLPPNREVADALRSTALRCFTSDTTAHFCVNPYNTCGEASAHLYGQF